MEFHKVRTRRSRFAKKKDSRDYGSKNKRMGRRDQKAQMHDATCGECGTNCKIPFEPRKNKIVLCDNCFKKSKQKKGYSKRDSPRRARKEKSRDESFKKNKYFEGGSEKFYSNLREKLFEILGGKKCTNCGFSDERALGFSDIDDKETFDSIRRGGSASSWGKYISNPDLARKKLQVLCLNCNQTQ